MCCLSSTIRLISNILSFTSTSFSSCLYAISNLDALNYCVSIDNSQLKVYLRSLVSQYRTDTDANIEEAAETIKKSAKRIRETSAAIRDTVITLRRSGAIEEITKAIREAVIVARDTAKDISETAEDLKERGIIKDTANAIEQTSVAARETIQMIRDAAREAVDIAPETTKTIKEAASKLRSSKKKTGQEEEAKEIAIIRGMAKETAGTTETSSEYEQGAAGTNK